MDSRVLRKKVPYEGFASWYEEKGIVLNLLYPSKYRFCRMLEYAYKSVSLNLPASPLIQFEHLFLESESDFGR